jgi:hypothetical protein
MIFEKFHNNDREPQPLGAGELAAELGFKSNRNPLRGIEYFIMQRDSTDNAGIIELLRSYAYNANLLLDEKEKEMGEVRTDKDSLALMLKLVDIRFQKGRYITLTGDFEDMSDAFYSPDIDNKTAELVEAAIHLTFLKICEKLISGVPEGVMKDSIRTTLSQMSEEQPWRLYLLAQAEGRD